MRWRHPAKRPNALAPAAERILFPFVGDGFSADDIAWLLPTCPARSSFCASEDPPLG
jgi:hypothetical protein